MSVHFGGGALVKTPLIGTKRKTTRAGLEFDDFERQRKTISSDLSQEIYRAKSIKEESSRGKEMSKKGDGAVTLLSLEGQGGSQAGSWRADRDAILQELGPGAEKQGLGSPPGGGGLRERVLRHQLLFPWSSTLLSLHHIRA
ncbi:hypothetical protein H920_08869 [Fukomys damarensis]|uniref:Uncharacterized protein n=1 Tax=Fukomys damarensis TaxID=885580 RepID=A0A091DC91_FUKDA|nr:hypothetical protein H920_08869 [Fukomys damarensis]